ncbi:hypothetical protein [Paenibacillus sp. Soil766]|uniref:hypothetical protein n=1 Tax=Paenibacillus sp. Soil766 TaxID=1736404 RepID=UPI001F30389B|nr:hypothetical protein [Paenibacillus sp. Soil766]
MLSPYIELYNLIVPKDNLLRHINELADFSVDYYSPQVIAHVEDWERKVGGNVKEYVFFIIK